MTTATHTGFWNWLNASEPQARTGPDCKPRPGPIFIHDAVVPLKNSTMLLEILRADDAVEDD